MIPPLKIRRIKIFGAILAAHLIAGCSSQKSSPERAEHPLSQAGDITENVNSLHAIPEDVRAAYLEANKPFTVENTKGFPPERVAKLLTYSFEIVDRDVAWTPGCGNGNRFVSAAKTKAGWWIIHESGSNFGNITTMCFVDVSSSPYRVTPIMRWQPTNR